MTISVKDKCLLLRLARQHIERHLLPDTDGRNDPEHIPNSLKIRCGAFVSLYIRNELRGCIGTFSENDLLHENVCSMAVSAATSDSRFSPVRSHELTEIKIEISVLSPRKKIRAPDEIILGTHGIYIKNDGLRGTLLPQVAIKENWTVEQFLGYCSKYKAGLGWDGWKTAEVYTYEAIVFNSGELGSEC